MMPNDPTNQGMNPYPNSASAAPAQQHGQNNLSYTLITDDAQSAHAASMRKVPLARRFGARFIDNLIVGLASGAAILALTLTGVTNTVLMTVVNVALAMLYFVALETRNGRTIGKVALGLRVIGPDEHSKPTVRESILRNVFLIVALIPMVGGAVALLAYLALAWSIKQSPSGQGEHDKLAGGTQVVFSSAS